MANPLYIRNPEENPDLPIHPDSLCARLVGKTVDDFCPDCASPATFIAADADDFTLKQLEDDIYYRERLAIVGVPCTDVPFATAAGAEEGFEGSSLVLDAWLPLASEHCNRLNSITGYQILPEDMPLNAAVYDSVRDVIWAVRGGFLFKMNATTGERISYVRICVPDFDDAYITYFPANDRLYITSWMTWGGMEATVDKKNLFKVDPDTMTVEATYNLDSGFGFTSDSNLFETGPAQLIVAQDHIFGISYDSSQSQSAQPYQFEPVAGTFLVGNDISIATGHRSDVVYDPDLDYLWFVEDVGAVSYDRVGVNIQTTVNLPANVNARGIAYRQDYLYFVVSDAGGQQFYHVLKKKSDDTGATTVIDMARPNARPFYIRYRSTTDRLYVPCWQDDTVVIIDPTTDTVESVKTGFESPWDVVFTPTKAFAIQHGLLGLKEIV